MAIRIRQIIKSNFNTGDKPTQDNFHDWIDSFIHKEEDRLYLDADGNLGVGGASNGEARLKITVDSRVSRPHILLEEDGRDFSRITFKNNQSSKFWTWAGSINPEDDDQSAMNLYYSNG